MRDGQTDSAVVRSHAYQELLLGVQKLDRRDPDWLRPEIASKNGCGERVLDPRLSEFVWRRSSSIPGGECNACQRAQAQEVPAKHWCPHEFPPGEREGLYRSPSRYR
jgi:hypothetical protein